MHYILCLQIIFFLIYKCMSNPFFPYLNTCDIIRTQNINDVQVTGSFPTVNSAYLCESQRWLQCL